MGMENRLDEMTELITTSFSDTFSTNDSYATFGNDVSSDIGQSFDAVSDSERRADT